MACPDPHLSPSTIFMFQPGCQFASSDNTSGLCPEAMQAFTEANEGYQPSYGDDDTTRQACDLFRDLFQTHCDVYFVFNGTAANSLLSSLCQSYQSVIAHQYAHVETDQCGAPEFFSNGSKLILAHGDNGLTPGMWSNCSPGAGICISQGRAP